MAGLLTFPQSALPSQPCSWPVTSSKQTLCLRGLQLQVQSRTLTGFPCIAVAYATRLPSILPQRYNILSQPPINPQEYSKIKKNKAPKYKGNYLTSAPKLEVWSCLGPVTWYLFTPLRGLHVPVYTWNPIGIDINSAKQQHYKPAPCTCEIL